MKHWINSIRLITIRLSFMNFLKMFGDNSHVNMNFTLNRSSYYAHNNIRIVYIREIDNFVN